jgi:carbon-monoxide dehydrogenase medium subunit
VIPAPTRYLRAQTVEDAVQALVHVGPEAKVLSGGQSLIPILRLRLSDPELLVDVSGIPAMKGVRDDGDSLWVGASTRYVDVLEHADVQRFCPSLVAVTQTVADPAVRHRGTIGGAVAHSDPAGDVPALLLALDASAEVAGTSGARVVPLSDLFVDYLQNSLAPNEIVTGVRVPKHGDGWHHHYEKFHRTALAWAIAGAVAVARTVDGVVDDVRVGLVNMGSRPLRATQVEAALRGRPAQADAIRRAADLVVQHVEVTGDVHGSRAYRTNLARVLTRRALSRALLVSDDPRLPAAPMTPERCDDAQLSGTRTETHLV